MPTLTTTIEDTSPVIIYSGSEGGDWSAGTSRQDTFVDQYSQSSYTVTKTDNASVSFSFYGTGVQIYGAKRSGHGFYQVVVDSFQYPSQNGDVSDAEFQTSLFSTVALNNGHHTVTMTNMGTASLDIDFITWQTPVGSTNEALLAWTDEDSNPSFTYSPASAWNANPSNLGMFSGGSGHSTSTAGASVEYTFEGDAVAIFGPVGPNGAPYSAQLDDQAPTNYSTSKEFYRPQMVLFEAGNLGSGKHTVRLVSQAWNNSALALSVDYAQVFTTQSLQSGSNQLSAGAIIGISIGGITCLLALIISFLLFRRFKPSAYKKIFRPREKSRKITFSVSSQPDTYRPINLDEPMPNPPLSSSSQQRLLVTPTSHATVTSPTTAWPPSGGSYNNSSAVVDLAPEQNEPNIQLVTIPYTTDGKYRPDLPGAPPLMPAPQGSRRPALLSPAELGHTLQVRASYSQIQTAARSALGTGQPSPAFEPESQNEQGVMMMQVSRGEDDRRPVAQPAAVLAPVRRAPSVPVSVSAFSFTDSVLSPPPQYERNLV